MPSFSYVGRDNRGTLVRGRVEAEDAGGAKARLRGEGVFITTLQVHSDAPRKAVSTLRLSDVAILTRNLAMLISAGLPLLQALEALVEQADDAKSRDLIAQLARDIEEGSSFSGALSRYPGVFSPLYVGIVSGGEASGRLDDALQRLAAYLERELEFRRKIRDSLIYPGVVLSLALVVLSVFLLYIIPVFERVYRTHGVLLPLPTRTLIAVSTTIRSRLPLIALVGFVLLLPPVRHKLWMMIRDAVQVVVLRIPHAKALVQVLIASRFTQAMGTMLRSGVPMLPALEVAGRAVGTPGFGRVIEVLSSDVSRGRRLSDAMRGTDQFPTMVVRMVAVGEQSGQLDVMLERAGIVLEREVDHRMTRFLALLEPVLILLIGALVGLILVALYLPMFGLARTIVK